MFFPSFGFWRNKAAPILATSGIVSNRLLEHNLYIGNNVTHYCIPETQNNTKHLEFCTKPAGDCKSGCFIDRTAVLVGSKPNELTFPGPIINAWKGDTLSINVHNRLRDPRMETETSIHWHGITQHQTSWADGVAFVTECPIPSGKSFKYEFPITDQAGTFWYHSHLGAQYCDGLRGALIVRDPQDPGRFGYNVEDDNDNTVITLSDWFRQRAAEGPSLPDLTLINGQVRPIISVQKDKKYRFRLISMACAVPWEFAIDEHRLNVIEVEGTLIKPYKIMRIPIHPGQRYSFIQLNPASGIPSLWSLTLYRRRGTRRRDYSQHYVAKSSKVVIKRSEPRVFFELPQSSEKDTTLDQDLEFHEIEVGLAKAPDGKFAGFALNGKKYERPSMPALLNILNNKMDPSDFPDGTIFVERNKTIQVTFKKADSIQGGPHPMHLHGHTFSVLRSVGDMRNLTEIDYIRHPPIQRDTVATSEFIHSANKTTSEVIIRFRTDNPGPWIMHCHIDAHLVLGMAIIFAEAKNEIIKYQKNMPTAAMKQQCVDYWASNPRPL
ncbi:hypothetical protein D9756_009531 [Leucocoprinus leucothites]|uniref:laccase n=1 Tax=Leucocoprinus leucothites TaxID=201217 RepID=A0A8H5CXZ1_9AGAR|nr:hypothetical protein D9756_009531 [Leucoagaricus leucothites]